MENFKIEFDKIMADYYIKSPFETLIKLKECFKKKPLVLYGCGSTSPAVISACNYLNIDITALCDTYKTGIYNDTGHVIISPECLLEEYPDANVIIGSYIFADDIKKKLNLMGFSDNQIYRPLITEYYIHPLDFIRDHFEGYEWAYNFFKDDNISKTLLLDRIKMYFTGAELRKNSIAPEYFEYGIINLGPKEVFIDGGAYTGDTAEEFIKQANSGMTGGYSHIYSFEPDHKAYLNAIHNLQRYENIDVIGKGLWSCDTELEFFSDGGNAGSSFVSGARTIKVSVTSIDNFFNNKPDDELPTFIKMDIEGAEKEALIGAKNVIKLKHPKLAICVYHKPEDIYELPKLISDFDPSYKITLRQCADGIYETVLYAV